MTHTNRLPVAAAILLSLAATASLSAQRLQTHRGDLAAGDETLDDGEYVDKYPFEVQAGQRVVLDLSSSDFDTYLVLRRPGGRATINDDYDDSTTRSRIEIIADESGEFSVWVTSFEPGEAGAYELTVSTAAATVGGTARKGEQRYEQGRLATDDETLRTGEYRDIYTVDGQAGEHLVIELRSHEFDPYLIAHVPGGAQLDNDDYEGDTTRSRITVTLPRAGTVQVLVTSFEAGQTGTYDLWITRN